MEVLLIERLTAEQAEEIFDSLCDLLRDSVENGSSVGFMLPLDQAIVEKYWREVIEKVAEGGQILLIARFGETIVGTVQLELCMKPNGSHRAEVQKLLVHSHFRSRGIGRKLMNTLEDIARAENRSLLVLDTWRGNVAEQLYRKSGYIVAGIIPNFAYSTEGTLEDTVIFYKHLE